MTYNAHLERSHYVHSSDPIRMPNTVYIIFQLNEKAEVFMNIL